MVLILNKDKLFPVVSVSLSLYCWTFLYRSVRFRLFLIIDLISSLGMYSKKLPVLLVISLPVSYYLSVKFLPLWDSRSHPSLRVWVLINLYTFGFVLQWNMDIVTVILILQPSLCSFVFMNTWRLPTIYVQRGGLSFHPQKSVYNTGSLG